MFKSDEAISGLIELLIVFLAGITTVLSIGDVCTTCFRIVVVVTVMHRRHAREERKAA